jgi:hypothetical protein
MSIEITQRNANRNQSTADYQRKNVFLFGNRYQEVTFLNNTGAALDVENGLLVKRNPANVAQLIPATAGTDGVDLPKTVGILSIEGKVTLADAATISANVCVSGDIDTSLVTFPAATTLATLAVAEGKTYKDILTALGFVLFNVVEGSKFDN